LISLSQSLKFVDKIYVDSRVKEEMKNYNLVQDVARVNFDPNRRDWVVAYDQ
jgi:hypothetical protein